MKCAKRLSVFIFPASIPHLLPNHPERKRVASEHRRLQPIKGNNEISWGILREQRQDLITFPGNPFRLQRPPPLLLQVPGRQKMSGGKPSDAHIFLQFANAHIFSSLQNLNQVQLRWPGWTGWTSWTGRGPRSRDLTRVSHLRYLQLLNFWAAPNICSKQEVIKV